jgi:two-component system sensor histidine kinase PilS (NtrC family)
MTTQIENPLLRIVPGSILDRRRNWYVFRAFNLYRLTLAALLLGVFLLDAQSRFFGQTNPSLFQWTATAYMSIVVLSIAGSIWRRPTLRVQSHIQALVDLLALSLLIHASGGMASNLSFLLVIAIAANAILLPLYSVLLIATASFFSMFGEWAYRVWDPLVASVGTGRLTADRVSGILANLQLYSDELGRLGMLGASFFTAALLTYTLAERARRSEEVARQSSQELLEMAELNQAIVQHLPSGLIVVDRIGKIRLMNDTGRELLSYHDPYQRIPLNDVSPVLSQRLANWLSTGLHNPKPFRQDEHLPDVTPSFSYLGANSGTDTLIFLENSEQVAQRLQQIKLAALGRLTAGIAHEIRNPLASISHAAQLLGESPTASGGDRRLGQIIHDNAKRANKIIANVLDMSRREKAKPEDFLLKPWLEEFCQEFLRGHRERTPQLEVRVQPPNLAIRFDTSHLHQALWNLCTNACVHGTAHGQVPRVRLAAQLDTARARPYLDIVDFGPGIPGVEIKKIFEPFFTTKPQGTGLGLYISREMCEANRAQLQYVRSPEHGSCFRIIFANPSKQENKWIIGMR